MKSIKFRLTFVVVVLVVVCFLTSFVSIYFSIGNVYKNKEGETLSDTAVRLAGIAEKVMGKTDIDGFSHSSMLEFIYEEDIETYSKNTGQYIITVDKYNRVIFASKNAKIFLQKNGIPKKEIAHILSGKSYKVTDDMSGYYGFNVITSGQPVVSGNEIIGAVICSLPTDYLSNLRYETMKSLLIIMVPILLISIFIIYIVSLNITKPISQITLASKQIARGDLTSRVLIKNKNEIGELGENFNKMAQSIEDSHRLKNEFISDVSHELRTPLTSVIGFLSGIQDGTIEEKDKNKYISVCLEESKRLSRVLNGFLDITRLERDDIPFSPSSFDIIKNIRENIFIFSDSILSKNIKVESRFSSQSLFVDGEEDNIDRVLINLFDNAVKFTNEDGKIIITVKDEGDKVGIDISNSGDGIPEEDLSNIFEKFYKRDKSRSADKKGTGLGLYFAKKIINRHGEIISVSCRESAEEQTIYTTFNFKIKKSKKESL